jgi:hypothetical protein
MGKHHKLRSDFRMTSLKKTRSGKKVDYGHRRGDVSSLWFSTFVIGCGSDCRVFSTPHIAVVTLCLDGFLYFVPTAGFSESVHAGYRDATIKIARDGLGRWVLPSINAYS